jgi:hypothetical protein
MTAPHYLQGAFRYRRLVGVTDCQDIIDAVKDEVLNQLPVGSRWTDLGANEVRSPIDVDGRFVRFDMNRIAAANLEAVIQDPAAITFTRRAAFVTSVSVNIFSGPSHLFIDYENEEGLWAAILDLFPRSQVDHAKYVVGNGARTAADALDGNYRTDKLFERNLADVYVITDALSMFESNDGFDRFLTKSLSNARLGHPATTLNLVGVQMRLAGRLPQTLLCPPDEIAGTDLVYPIDMATTATFRTLFVQVSAAPATYFKMAVRKS